MERTNQNPANEPERLTRLKEKLGCRNPSYWRMHQMLQKKWEDDISRRIRTDRKKRELEAITHLAINAIDGIYTIAKPLVHLYLTGKPDSQKSNDQPKDGNHEQ